MNIIEIGLPFICVHCKNKLIKIQSIDFNTLGKIDLNILKAQYLHEFERKKILEDKAKSNLMSVTIAVTLIINSFSIFDGNKLCLYPAIIKYLLLFLFIISVIYMIIAGILSMNILINENIVYKMDFKDYVLEESLVRQRYNYNITENCKQNLRRNNIIFASYQCIVNSLILICLFMIIGITGII